MTLAENVRTESGLADELHALYTRAKNEVGEKDLAHIRNATVYGQAIEARRLELLSVGSPGPSGAQPRWRCCTG